MFRAFVPIALTIVFCVLPGCGPPAMPPSMAADIVLLNGKIITVDEDDTVAEAVAIEDGKIVAVGSTAEIEAYAGSETERIDLEGRAATPGLLDAHNHFASGGVSRLFVLNLSYPEVESVAEVVEKVAAQVETLGAGEWVRGRGWDEGKFTELRYIYASDLDPVTPEHPVWLTHTMGHYGVANSVALEMAGITRETPEPFGGTIDRHPDGTPTGVLKESAMGLVTRLIPETSPEEWEQGITAMARAFNEEGMTGLKDPGIGTTQWRAYQEVLARGELSVRVFALWGLPGEGTTVEAAETLAERIGPFTKPYISTGDDHLVSGGVKLFMDGSGGARTAWLYDEWNKGFEEVDEGNHGYPAAEPDVRREQIRLLHDAGIHVSVHSIGDRAIDWVMDSYAIALEENPTEGLRHGIIHSNIPSDHALELMAQLQKEYDAGYPEPSATFMWWIGDTYAGNFGPGRNPRLNPFKTYLDMGIRWANGSDFSVTPFPARYGLWASAARETLLGVYGPNPYGLPEAVDVRTALQSQTIWTARQMFLEDEIGSLEAGKYADIAVWDRDPYTVPVEELKEMKCEMTLFNGEVVYRAE